MTLTMLNSLSKTPVPTRSATASAFRLGNIERRVAHSHSIVAGISNSLKPLDSCTCESIFLPSG
jgi:hypothetical protein